MIRSARYNQKFINFKSKREDLISTSSLIVTRIQNQLLIQQREATLLTKIKDQLPNSNPPKLLRIQKKLNNSAM